MRSLIADCLLLASLALILNLMGLKFPSIQPAPSAPTKPEPDKAKARRLRGEDSQVLRPSLGMDNRPLDEETEQIVGKLSTGGGIGPDAKTEVACDLPSDLLFHNVGGRDGGGLCVFASITYAALYQNEPKLIGFFDAMKKERGSGWPEKVDQMIAKHGQGASYLQYEGSDPAILKAALTSGRMPCVTYNGHDPHYGNHSIAHMVSLVCYDDGTDLAAIRDNNFTGPNDLVWMSIKEFLRRWKGGGGGWAVVLLAPPPPPPPKN
jgi:hypothetical protein